MAQFIEFSNNHLALVVAFAAVLAALVASLMQGGGKLAISPARAVQLMNTEDAVALDIRPEKAFRSGHILHSVHVTQDDITNMAGKIEKFRDRPVIVCCERGLSSVASAKALKRAGFPTVYSLQGGIEAWRADGLPLRGAK